MHCTRARFIARPATSLFASKAERSSVRDGLQLPCFASSMPRLDSAVRSCGSSFRTLLKCLLVQPGYLRALRLDCRRHRVLLYRSRLRFAAARNKLPCLWLGRPISFEQRLVVRHSKIPLCRAGGKNRHQVPACQTLCIGGQGLRAAGESGGLSTRRAGYFLRRCDACGSLYSRDFPDDATRQIAAGYDRRDIWHGRTRRAAPEAA